MPSYFDFINSCWSLSSLGVSEATEVGQDRPLDAPTLRICGQSVSGAFLSRLNRCSSTKNVISTLRELRGVYAFVYYRPDLCRVFLGRDAFGRASLVWARHGEQLLIAHSTSPHTSCSWRDHPHAMISCVRVGRGGGREGEAEGVFDDADLTTFLDSYPDSSDAEWRALFSSLTVSVDNSKAALFQVSCATGGDASAESAELWRRVTAAVEEGLREEEGEDAASVVCFSGGVDSLLVAHCLHRALPHDRGIDLVNVAFGVDKKACSQAPDRKRATDALRHLKQMCGSRAWRLVLVDVDARELAECRQTIAAAAAPANTVLDDSLSCVLWFAVRSEGRCADGGQRVRCAGGSRWVGSGADELFAGYARHRTAYERHGVHSVAAECSSELRRLGVRNGGRDARVAASLGNTLRAPLLDDGVVEWANGLPIGAKCDLSRPRGDGEKLIIREALRSIGAPHSAPKQAMQFGSRMAKLDNAGKEVKGSNISSRLEALRS